MSPQKISNKKRKTLPIVMSPEKLTLLEKLELKNRLIAEHPKNFSDRELNYLCHLIAEDIDDHTHEE